MNNISEILLNIIFWKNVSVSHGLKKQPPEVIYKKKMFLKILRNSQEHTCIGLFVLTKLQVFGLQLY